MEFPARVWWLIVGTLIAISVVTLVGSPIVAEDNDLWYHLSHGRYLFSTGDIPDTSYFSFISPAKTWTDYYWLFQACVYSIHSVGGYFGLLLWRAALFAAFLLTIAAFLRGPRGAPKVHLQPPMDLRRALCFGGVLGLFLVHSYHKFELIRPHAVSYLFLALFLYLLEVKPPGASGRRLWWLPVIAVLWTNFHGIEYPVLLLVAGAYIFESWIDRVRGLRADPQTGASPETVRLSIVLGLSMLAVFLTPHGAKLVKVPFVSIEYASHYIQEHTRLGWQEFLTYRLTTDGFDFLSAFNVLLALAVLGAIIEARRGSLRISHLLMLIGGLVLLGKAVRLAQECALLALPLIRTAALTAAEVRWPRRAKVLAAALTIAFLASPLAFLGQRLPDPAQRWPLSLKNLPHGVANFLDHVDTGGTVMNNPNVGGYLQWTLDADYQTFMDLEIPFLFADEDMFEIASAFFDAKALSRFIHSYRPDYIAATLASTEFPARIAAHPDYVPVFFDDQGVLYADRRRHPGVVGDYALVHVEPFTFTGQRFSVWSDDQRRARLDELERLAAIDADISSVNQSLAILYNLDGRYDLAEAPARRVIARDPDLARGHAVLADALQGQGQLDEAIATYRRAIRRSTDGAERASIYKSLSRAHFQAGDLRAAYETFRRGVGKFNVEASFDDLFRLGVMAAAAGEPGDARKMFSFALLKVAPDETERRRQVEENLAALD